MKSNVKSVILHFLNIIATLLCGSVAFIFALMGLSYKSTDFISSNHALLASIIYGIVFILLLVYLLLYLFGKKTAYKSVFVALFFLALFAVIFYFLCSSGLISKINSIQALREYIEQTGSMAAIIFTVFQFLQVVILPMPGSVSVAAGVALFGPFECTVYSFIGITLGSVLAFAVGRLIGYKAACWIVGKESLDKWLKRIKGKDYLLLTLMFLLPLFPDDVLCFVAGLSSMTWGYFLLMITLTRAVSIASTAYSIGFIPLNTWWGVAIWIVILILIAFSFVLVFKFSDKIDKFVKGKFIKGKFNVKRKKKN